MAATLSRNPCSDYLPPPFPTSKRAACDRCRVQKLKCSRAPRAETCTRCARSGATCITSYPRPLGRAPKAPYMVVADAAAATAQGLQPSLRASSMARQHPSAAAASSSQLQPRDTGNSNTNNNSSSSTSQVGGSSSDAQSSPTSTRGSTAMSGSSSSSARQNVHSPFMSKADGSSAVVSLSATTTASASHSNASDMFCFSPNDDESDMLDFSSAAHDAILHDVSSALSADDTAFHHHHHHHDDFSLDDLGHFSVFEASLPPSQDDAGGDGGGLGLSKRVVAPAYGMSKAAPAGGLDHNLILGSDHRLSSLNLSISKRLDSALALGGHESQDTPSRSDATTAAAAPTAHDGASNQEQHDGPKLLSEALNDTSEFLIIIQSYRNRAERRGSSSWSNSGGDHSGGEQSSPGPRLGLVNTLNLLSVYLQLVELYDKLFQSSFSFLLQDASAEGVVLDRQEAAASSLPSIGFSPSLMQQRGGGLQAKVLIHAILHQFENIERTIGLPVDYRVTGRDDDYAGLLREGSAMNLLEAIAGESQPHQAMEGYHAELKSVGSLRTILQRMQIALNM